MSLGVLGKPVWPNSHPALGDMSPAEPQTPLQVVEILDLYTAVYQPLQTPDEEVHGI